MRDCPNAEMRDQLPEFVSGRLGASARAAVEAHLAGCADCSAEVDLLRSLSTALVAAQSARAPRMDVERIVAALPAPRRARSAWYRTTRWRAAAGLLLMAGASSFLWSDRTAPPAPSEPVVADAMSFAGGVSDLSEAQLTALLGDMEKISSTPVVDLELSPLSPLSPVAPGKGS